MILEQCKGVHCVDLDESFQTHLQNLASIQPRTSRPKFADTNIILPSTHCTPPLGHKFRSGCVARIHSRSDSGCRGMPTFSAPRDRRRSLRSRPRPERYLLRRLTHEGRRGQSGHTNQPFLPNSENHPEKTHILYRF